LISFLAILTITVIYIEIQEVLIFIPVIALPIVLSTLFYK